MNPIVWLMRAKRLARHPPSPRRVKWFLAVVAASLLIAGIEWLFGWPDWLTVDRGRLIP